MSEITDPTKMPITTPINIRLKIPITDISVVMVILLFLTGRDGGGQSGAATPTRRVIDRQGRAIRDVGSDSRSWVNFPF